MKRSTSGKMKSSESPETQHLYLIKLNVLEYSPTSGLLSEQPLPMPNVFLLPKVPYSFSADISLRDLNGTLSITWTPTASPLPGAGKAKTLNKNTTSATLSKPASKKQCTLSDRRTSTMSRKD